MFKLATILSFFFYNSLDLEFETILSLEFEMVLTVF